MYVPHLETLTRNYSSVQLKFTRCYISTISQLKQKKEIILQNHTPCFFQFLTRWPPCGMIPQTLKCGRHNCQADLSGSTLSWTRFPLSTHLLVTRWQNTPQTPPVHGSDFCLIMVKQDVESPVGLPDPNIGWLQMHWDPGGYLELPWGSLYHNYNKFALQFFGFQPSGLHLHAYGKYLHLGKRLYNLKLSINMSIKWHKTQGGTFYHFKGNNKTQL